MKILFLILGCSISAAAQSVPVKPCQLRTPPTIRGLSLGMTRSESNRILNSEKKTAEVLPQPQYFGVDSITREFEDDKLIELGVAYKQDVKWTSREFARNLSRNLHLPFNAWSSFPSKMGIMFCNGFAVRYYATINYVRLTREHTQPSKNENMIKQKAFKP